MSNYILYNKDSTTLEEVLDSSVDLILSDPPYGVNFKNTFYDDSIDYILDNIDTWYKNYYRVLKNDSYLVLYVGVKTLHIWIQKGIDNGFTYKNILATRSFNNGAVSPSNNFGFQFQPIIIFSKGNGRPFNEVDFIPTSVEWYKDKRNKNPKPFTYAYPNFIKTEWAFATEKRASKNLHPNEKNVKLLAFLVKVFTNENDIVLDPFSGSFSTGVASINSNRNFIGYEKNIDYFNKGKERLDNLGVKNE